MATFSVERAAASLLEARRSRRPVVVDPTGPGSFEEAFAVQDAVARSLGPPGAWKVGRSPDGRHTAAPIAADLVRPSPCTWPADTLLRIGIEAEIAFRLGRDLPARGEPYTADEVRAAIGSVHAAIEIVDSRFDAWPVPNPLWALADNQNNGGFVYAMDGRPLTHGDLSQADVTIAVGGKQAFAARGKNPGGDPIALLVWLAGHLATTRDGLAAGAFVTTGSLNGILFVEPGAEVAVDIAGIGRVELRVPRGSGSDG